MYIKTCSTKDSWENLNPEIGEVVCFEDNESNTKELKMWNGIEWDPVKADAKSEVSMTAYDINKQVIAQLPPLTKIELDAARTTIMDYVNANPQTFYMLLCRELNYYTVLMRDPPNAVLRDTVDTVLIECAQCVGEIKAIDFVDGAIEIWVTNPDDTYAMYLFGYDRGVERCQ
jgi:hypothetical protein